MNYRKLIKRIAKANNTTVEEVNREIKSAIKSAGLHIDPKLFIEAVSLTVINGGFRKNGVNNN